MVFVCALCPERFTSTHALSRHARSHRDSAYFIDGDVVANSAIDGLHREGMRTAQGYTDGGMVSGGMARLHTGAYIQESMARDDVELVESVLSTDELTSVISKDVLTVCCADGNIESSSVELLEVRVSLGSCDVTGVM